ncbi:MAG: hypothetical protein NC817_00360 [Candidatus Omnitrophica bacterium]|nr:hypothetical protein [Candidatus Omnitrophota bacterium]
MCPYSYYQIMRISKDRKQQRYHLVMFAKEKSIKPAANFYATTTNPVRKWIKRFEESGYSGLHDLSHDLNILPLLCL